MITAPFFDTASTDSVDVPPMIVAGDSAASGPPPLLAVIWYNDPITCRLADTSLQSHSGSPDAATSDIDPIHGEFRHEAAIVERIASVIGTDPVSIAFSQYTRAIWFLRKTIFRSSLESATRNLIEARTTLLESIKDYDEYVRAARAINPDANVIAIPNRFILPAPTYDEEPIYTAAHAVAGMIVSNLMR